MDQNIGKSTIYFSFDSADVEMKLEPVNKFSEYIKPRKNVILPAVKYSRIDSLKARVFTISYRTEKVNSKIFGNPSLMIWSFVVQMTTHFVRDFQENPISPFRDPLMLHMLMRKLESMPAGSSSPNPWPTSTKSINFVNLATKLVKICQMWNAKSSKTSFEKIRLREYAYWKQLLKHCTKNEVFH